MNSTPSINWQILVTWLGFAVIASATCAFLTTHSLKAKIDFINKIGWGLGGEEVAHFKPENLFQPGQRAAYFGES